MVKLSARSKFVLINVDEFIILLIALAIVYWLLPQYFLSALIIAIIGFTIFIIAKYYLIYPVLDDSSKSFDVLHLNGEVVSMVTPSDGRVRIGQEIWHARCNDGQIPVGTIVKILRREGLTLWVIPISSE